MKIKTGIQLIASFAGLAASAQAFAVGCACNWELNDEDGGNLGSPVTCPSGTGSPTCAQDTFYSNSLVGDKSAGWRYRAKCTVGSVTAYNPPLNSDGTSSYFITSTMISPLGCSVSQL